MAKTSGGVRKVKIVDYYKRSKELREEALMYAEKLKGNPINFRITNGIEMEVEITKSDIKTIVGKNTKDSKFNAIKNKLAQDIEGYIRKGKYEGWRSVERDKHKETAYFAYYSRALGAKTYLAIRKVKDTGKFKPYAIINETMYNAKRDKVNTKMPPK